jgi:hypothetical protein
MSDVFIEYHATVSGTEKIFRVFVRVSAAKIAEYRREKGDKRSDDIEIACTLSQPAAMTRPHLLQLREYSLDVYYSDVLPEELQNRLPTAEQDGLAFWDA